MGLISRVSSRTYRLYPKNMLKFKKLVTSGYAITKPIPTNTGVHLHCSARSLPSSVCTNTNLFASNNKTGTSVLVKQQSYAPFSTTAALEHKRHIVYQLRRRKRRRLMQLNMRYADMMKDRNVELENFTTEREQQDLELVWKENGLDEEPPMLSPEKKREIVMRWYKEGKIYNIMGYDELVDYNLRTPIKAPRFKVQPKVWYLNAETPRHAAGLHMNKTNVKAWTRTPNAGELA